jgi:hypothetical protein
MSWLDRINRSVQIEEILVFNGNYIALQELLRAEKEDFDVLWESNYTFQFHAFTSIGTMRGLRINGYATVYSSKEEENQVQITLHTKTRLEIYFFLVGMLVFMLVGLYSVDFPTNCLALGFPFLVLIPWMVYRMQEQALFRYFRLFLEQ